jgi:hypothetical protein
MQRYLTLRTRNVKHTTPATDAAATNAAAYGNLSAKKLTSKMTKNSKATRQ